MGTLADSRPKLVAGSPEGNVGHIDGKPREARMHHPKGLTVDDRGNIYIADTINMAIRKISDAGNCHICFLLAIAFYLCSASHYKVDLFPFLL